MSIRDTPLLISYCSGEERLIQQPSEGGNTVARRASGSTVDLRAASETNSKPWSEPWMSHLRQILVTLCVANNDPQAGRSTQTQPITAKIFRYETLRRLLCGYRSGEGRL